MRFRSVSAVLGRRKVIAGLVAVSAVAAGLAFATGAQAAGPPTYEPDPTSVGTVSFYNATGAQITSGSVNDSPLAAWYKASGVGVDPRDNLANVAYATPQDGVLPGSWTTVETWTSTQPFPHAGAPGGLATTTNAVVQGATTDGGLQGHIDAFPSASTLNPGIYQIRIYTNRAGEGGHATYYASDVQVTGTTWTQVYPAAAVATATTTALTVAPPSPQPGGTSVGLTATVAAATGPAPTNGTVRFFDGSTQIGADKPFTGAPVTISTSTLSVGVHQLTAIYVPSGTTFAGSTSPATSYTIVAAATATTTTLAVSPPSPVNVGTTATLTATVGPAAAAGTVQFLDGATPIGAPVTVSAGKATTTTSTLSVATHQLKAVFTPTDPTAYAPSSSAAIAYQVTPAAATTTTTTLTVAPASPAAAGAEVTLTGTVSPSTAVGSMKFFDGSTLLGSAAVAGGTATIKTTTLSPGSHSLTAAFVPTDPLVFGSSVSAATAYVVSPPPATTTTTALAVTPGTTAPAGTSVTLTATLTPSAATGSVQFKDGTTALGASVPVTAGTAMLSTSALAIGTHSLTAQFVPTDAAVYTASTSTAVSYVITKPPPGATTTTLAVAPAGPVVVGDTVTLTATVTPAAAAGQVQFFDGATPLGAAVDLAAGAATTTTDALAVGSHALSATFTPATDTYTPSTSATVTLVVRPKPTATTTTLAVSPTGTVPFASTVTLTATVTPDAAGSVQFLDGTTVLGTVPVAAGTASTTTSILAGGPHSLTARFVPTDAGAFASSTSVALSLTVEPPPAQSTSTSLQVTPAGPVSAGATVTLKASITPVAAAGTVSFLDGTTPLGTAPVVAGAASLTTTTLPTGTRSLTAAFVPANAAAYLPSTSAAISLDVRAAPKIDSVTVDGSEVQPGDAIAPGSVVTITGSGFTAGETVTGAVQSTPTTLGTAKADAQGALTIVETLPANLAAGDHTLSLAGAVGTATFAFTVSAAPSPTAGPTGADSSSGAAGDGAVAGDGSAAGGGGSDLASTGADVLLTTLIALALLGVGAAVLVVGRRRGQARHVR